MKTAAAFLSTLLAVSATAFAQAPVQNSPNQNTAVITTTGLNGEQKTSTVVIPATSYCPVSMQAKQRGMTEMVKTKKNAPNPEPDAMPKPAQHIHLILAGFGKDRRVTEATVTARGLSSRGRAINTNLVAGGQASDLSRKLDVKFTANDDGTVSANLDLPAFTTVTSLQLESITYSDGSSWKLADEKACTVAPDPLMLIAGR
jgi:hypothetical protein